MNLIRRHSKNYNFVGNSVTGETFRWGATFKDNPSSAPWPELADISISNYCTKQCEYCYRDSTTAGAFMSPTDYEFVLSELTHKKWGTVFQVALGGGEPLEHPEIGSILKITTAHNVVPNLTTNAHRITPQICQLLKASLGAIAVSVEKISNAPLEEIRCLIHHGIRINIHFILRKSTIHQAIELVQGVHDKYLQGLNAVVFLTYKPAGRAADTDLLDEADAIAFVSALNASRSKIRMGFDACFVPLLLHATKTDTRLIDPCETGFFSVYIDENLYVMPCSFSNLEAHKWSLREYSFESIWSDKLVPYRKAFSNSCARECAQKSECRGACPYFPETTLCFSDRSEGALTCL